MASLDTLLVGDERRTVVVVDDFAADPDRLRRVAGEQPFTPALHAYPGTRAALPDDYWRRQDEVVGRAITLILGRETAYDVIDASFSIVTTARSALSVAQRLPHCDAHDPGRIALVHFLGSAKESGGTAFFRHRSTRFETIDRERAPIYEGQLDAELRYGGLPPADYLGADDRLFEMIASVPARPNRALLYRSFALHSGVVPVTASLSPDPAVGRLTVTGFLATR